MKAKKFYFDDEEIGLAAETSHPNFSAVATEEFYYDCTDEFSPFGNDDGADTLYNLQDWYRETRGRGKVTNWLFRLIDGYGFKYKSKWAAGITDWEQLTALAKEDPHFIGCMDRTIIGTGFGQAKISGFIDNDLKQVVLTALTRQKQIHEASLEHPTGEPNPGNISNDERGKELLKEYLGRLAQMESDLQKISTTEAK